MTRKINIAGQNYRITLTNHFISRVRERNIPVDKILSTLTYIVENNHYSRQYQKHIIKNTIYNFSLVVNTKQINHFKLITAMNNTHCQDKNAKIIVVE